MSMDRPDFVPPGEPCPNCSHDFDAHVLVAMGDPADGGFVVCPEGCDCFGEYTKVEYREDEFRAMFTEAEQAAFAEGRSVVRNSTKEPPAPGGKATNPTGAGGAGTRKWSNRFRRRRKGSGGSSN